MPLSSIKSITCNPSRPIRSPKLQNKRRTGIYVRCVLAQATAGGQSGPILALKEWAVTVAALERGEQTVRPFHPSVDWCDSLQCPFCYSLCSTPYAIITSCRNTTSVGVQILLRKGGIREPGFQIPAQQFLLLPNAFHTEGQLLKPEAQKGYKQVRHSLCFLKSGCLCVPEIPGNRREDVDLH